MKEDKDITDLLRLSDKWTHLHLTDITDFSTLMTFEDLMTHLEHLIL